MATWIRGSGKTIKRKRLFKRDEQDLLMMECHRCDKYKYYPSEFWVGSKSDSNCNDASCVCMECQRRIWMEQSSKRRFLLRARGLSSRKRPLGLQQTRKPLYL
jgi:hypothetical protein